ncbi:DedA family protein [Paenibacillus pinisoli]|uniref:DedA family protein n=1 Tax=Paenibacillus pinisoli TaxID=1276110 RepID=A0A3A6PMH9_9BACL|nr:YqaA family protein [Paenibacillus pinisoli]RJX39449.1 DedA family protein [Paenibacillus pinisoli]
MFQAFIDFLKDYGPLGLFVHSFLDAVIFPVPAFFLQVSLSIMNPTTALWLATVGYIACLLGTPVGYYLGKIMGKSVLYRFLKTEWIDAATSRFQKNGEAAILIGSFTPIPFKVFTILSGALNFPLWRLIGYAAVGRAVKFYAVGALFYFYGRAAESMVKDVSLYTFVIAVPLIAIFLFVRSRIRKKKQLKQEAEEQPAKDHQAAEGSDQAMERHAAAEHQPVLEQQAAAERHTAADRQAKADRHPAAAELKNDVSS